MAGRVRKFGRYKYWIRDVDGNPLITALATQINENSLKACIEEQMGRVDGADHYDYVKFGEY